MRSGVWDLGRKSSIPLRSTQDDTGDSMSMCHPERAVEPVGRCEASGSIVAKNGHVNPKGIFLYIVYIVVQTQPPNFLCNTF